MKKLFRSHKAKAATGFLLSSLRPNNIQRLLFYFLILGIPTQFGRHFWPDFSYVIGIRVDYLSPTLYLTDILILLLFLSWVFSKLRIKNHELRIKSALKYWKIFTVLIFIFVGILLSKSPQAGVYGLIKLLEFGFLGFYIAKNIHRFKLQNILLMFSFGIIFESFLSISQYFNHGSLQGFFYFFGERFFTSLTPGIANASLGGELFLRPYGTFPHPNVLAGYLLIGMMLIISNFKFPISNFKKITLLISVLLGTIALFLTLSRVAILVWLIVFGSWLIVRGIKKIKLKTSIFYILFSIFLLLLISFIFANSSFRYRFTNINLSDESIVQRENLIQSSLAMVKDHPIFGVGLNNFLVELPNVHKQDSNVFYLQPVHNIFLLVAAQTGIVGLFFFLWFIFKTYKRIGNHELGIRNQGSIIHNSQFIILSTVLVLGLFDHYFLTLQQGQLLFSFVLGLCWADSEASG